MNNVPLSAKILILVLLASVTSQAAPAGKKYSEYPNTNNLFDAMIMLWASTNAAAGITNFNMQWGQFRAILATNFGNQFWTSIAGYDTFYDSFNGSALSAGTVGTLGWTGLAAGAGGSAIAVSNAPNHFGTLAITTGGSSNSLHSIFLSSTFKDKPWIPPLNNDVGWTNRIIWRMNGTNDVRAFLVLQAGTQTSTTDITNAIGIRLVTGSSSQIQGYTNDGSTSTTTNLGAVVSNTWYTNEIWSLVAGTILFNINDGSPAAISTTLPTTGLTPAIMAGKTATTAAASLEIDDWMLTNAK